MGNNVLQSVSLNRNHYSPSYFRHQFPFVSLILKNNRVVDAISGLPWYLLPLQNQKDIAHILNRAQNGTVLRIGPFSRLDYETATNVRIERYPIRFHMNLSN